MKILVAGGCGYVGTQLVKTLKQRNHKVTIVDLEWFGNNTGQKVINKDIFDINANDLSNFDCVIFVAGLSNDPMADFSPAKNFIYNVLYIKDTDQFQRPSRMLLIRIKLEKFTI